MSDATINDIRNGAESAQRLVALFRGLDDVAKALNKIGSLLAYEKEVQARVDTMKQQEATARMETEKALAALAVTRETTAQTVAALTKNVQDERTRLAHLVQQNKEAEQAGAEAIKGRLEEAKNLQDAMVRLNDQRVNVGNEVAGLQARRDQLAAILAGVR